MKMIYQERDNRRKRKRLVEAAVGLAAFAIGIGFLSWFNPHIFSPIVQSAGRPFFIARQYVGSGLGLTFGSLRSNKSLVAENKELKDKLMLYEAVIAERTIYKNENEQLQELMSKLPSPQAFTLARILSKPGFSPYDTIIIDAGEQNGVAIGRYVFADESVAVGIVTAVSGKTSTVKLFSSPGEETSVFIGNQSLQAAAVGKGGQNFELKLPRNSGVVVGDPVVLTTEPYHLIGMIELINVTPADSYEQVLFKGAVDVSRLTYVLVQK